jgi:DNA polymerase V
MPMTESLPFSILNPAQPLPPIRDGLDWFHLAKPKKNRRLPLFISKVAAGFPSPADDYVEKTLDLEELLIQKPAATFFVRAQGDSMLGAGIHPNDILVVDRSKEPMPDKIVICALNGELTVKRLMVTDGQWRLKAENPAYPDIPLTDDLETVFWGTVTNVIHPV